MLECDIPNDLPKDGTIQHNAIGGVLDSSNSRKIQTDLTHVKTIQYDAKVEVKQLALIFSL